jgi:hypothetical protein
MDITLFLDDEKNTLTVIVKDDFLPIFKQYNKKKYFNMPIAAELLCTYNKNTVFIHAFYVYASLSYMKYNEYLVPEELKKTRGLGKKMLCLAIN